MLWHYCCIKSCKEKELNTWQELSRLDYNCLIVVGDGNCCVCKVECTKYVVFAYNLLERELHILSSERLTVLPLYVLPEVKCIATILRVDCIAGSKVWNYTEVIRICKKGLKYLCIDKTVVPCACIGIKCGRFRYQIDDEVSSHCN